MVVAQLVGSLLWGADEGPKHFDLVMEPVTTGPSALASVVEVRDHITVLELSDPYDRGLIVPRADVTREFLSVHPDEYDILVTFTTFDFDSGGAVGFASVVKNDVEGIGLPLFDQSSDFGSTGKFQTYIDMKRLEGWSTDPLDPEFERTLETLMHEVQHRWGSYVHHQLPGGGESDLLLGRGAAHWSYLLDSDASLHYGSQWAINGDGSFTAVTVKKRLSPLDLYLAGFLPAEEVPPFVLIENDSVDAEQLPQLGATVSGVPRMVTVEDIIAVEGPRSPAVEDAPRDLRMGFALIKRPGDVVDDSMFVALDRLRREAATRFSVLTGGRALLHVEPPGSAPGTPGDPEVVEGGGDRPGADFDAGLFWLAAQRNPDGAWRDTEGTQFRDTTVGLLAMSQLAPEGPVDAQSMSWLLAQPQSNTDYLARLVLLRQQLGGNPAAERDRLLQTQNTEGSWGVTPSFEGDPLDTGFALEAVADFAPATAVQEAVSYLLGTQNPDGGWSHVKGGPSRTSATVQVLEGLKAAGAQPPPGSIEFLLTRQNLDGGFGDSPSTTHDTALVLHTLASLRLLPVEVETPALTYLESRQTIDGSWDGSVYSTALALLAWDILQVPPPIPVDLEVTPSDLTVEGDLRTGAEARFLISLRNLGGEDSEPSLVRYSIDDGQEVVEIAIEPIQIAAQAEIERTVTWTVDRVGSLELLVEIDPFDGVAESDETNNTARVSFETTALDQANLVVESSTLLFDPSPALEGLPLAISILVQNRGGIDSGAVDVALYDGDPANGGVELQRSTLPNLPALGSELVNWVWSLPGPVGAHLMVVVVDPDAAISEFSETDNVAFNDLEVVSLPDLALSSSSLSLNPALSNPGQSVSLTVGVANLGAQPAEAVVVRVLSGPVAGAGTPVAVDQVLSALPPNSSSDLVFEWTYGGGTQVLTAWVDPLDSVVEGVEDNNQASLAVSEPTGDFFVSEPYFSPNGDGIRDATRFFFQLASRQTVSVEIRAIRSGLPIRSYTGPELQETTGGSFLWDGTEDSGSIGRDGEYSLELVGASGQVIGTALASLDTNRRPLLEAAGTLYERGDNLTCLLPTVNAGPIRNSVSMVVTRDEQWGYFFVNSLSDPAYPPGIYRMRPKGGSPELVLEWDRSEDGAINSLELSRDGRYLAFMTGNAFGDLYIADGDGSNLRLAYSPIYQLVGFDSSDRVILNDLNSISIWAVPADSGLTPEMLYQSDFVDLFNLVLAPGEQDQFLVTEYSADEAVLVF